MVSGIAEQEDNGLMRSHEHDLVAFKTLSRFWLAQHSRCVVLVMDMTSTYFCIVLNQGHNSNLPLSFFFFLDTFLLFLNATFSR